MSSVSDQVSRVKNFIDDEAVEDEDGECSDFESDGDHEEELATFIDNSTNTNTLEDAVVGWSDWNTEQETADALVEVARDIERRYSRVRVDDDEHPNSRAPALGDPSIWRIKVIPGRERMIVVEVLRQALGNVLPNRSMALSAMTRDSIKGYVYVEANDFAAVTATLARVPGVRYSTRGSLFADLVPIDDYVRLMEMETRRIEPGSWVSMKKKGTYYNDLAFVHEINKEDLIARVLLVPRIRLYSKRKRQGRPSPSLFDKVAVEATYGAESIEERNRYHFFNKRVYDFGLLDIDIHFCDVSSKSVDPTSYDLTYFRRTRHPAILKALAVVDGKLYVGDRVRITSGTYTSLCGRVLSVDDGNMVKVQADDTDFGVFQVGSWEVYPHFCLGDSVVVRGGSHSGEQGYIIGTEEKAVVIFVRKNDVASWMEPGNEIVVERYYVHANPSCPELWGKTSTIALNKGEKDINEFLVGETMYTGRDGYRHMEVVFVKGHLKGHLGVVVDSRHEDENPTFVVRTSSQTITHVHTVQADDIRERFTRLPMSKALWVPVSRTELPDAPPHERPRTPSTSSSSLPDAETPLSPAWDPAAGFVKTPKVVPTPPEPGTWLLDYRLRYKRLDVRIFGTTKSLFRNGRYENESGFLVLTDKVKNTNDSVTVKVGYQESRLSFPVRYLVPETTTERVRVGSSAPSTQSVVSVPGERVVVIGPDVDGASDLIGNYAVVLQSLYQLLAGQVYVSVISGPSYGHGRYFFVDSICRSTNGIVDWFGTNYV